MYPFYLGIDLHLKRTYTVLMDSTGKVLDERQVQNINMKEYLKEKVPRETYAVLEATRNWPFMYDLLGEQVERVELAHPKELKAIASAAVKTDRIDAKVLAHLARLDFLPISYAAHRRSVICGCTCGIGSGLFDNVPRQKTAFMRFWPATI